MFWGIFKAAFKGGLPNLLVASIQTQLLMFLFVKFHQRIVNTLPDLAVYQL